MPPAGIGIPTGLMNDRVPGLTAVLVTGTDEPQEAILDGDRTGCDRQPAVGTRFRCLCGEAPRASLERPLLKGARVGMTTYSVAIRRQRARTVSGSTNAVWQATLAMHEPPPVWGTCTASGSPSQS